MTLDALIALCLIERQYFSIKTHTDKPGLVTLILRTHSDAAKSSRRLEVTGDMQEIIEHCGVFFAKNA